MRTSRSVAQSSPGTGTEVRRGSRPTQNSNPTLTSPHVVCRSVGSWRCSATNHANLAAPSTQNVSEMSDIGSGRSTATSFTCSRRRKYSAASGQSMAANEFNTFGAAPAARYPPASPTASMRVHAASMAAQSLGPAMEPPDASRTVGEGPSPSTSQASATSSGSPTGSGAGAAGGGSMTGSGTGSRSPGGSVRGGRGVGRRWAR